MPGLRLTDSRTGSLVSLTGAGRLAPGNDDVGTLLAVDTAARTAEVLGLRVTTVDVAGVAELNLRPSNGAGAPDVVLRRPWGPAGPPYRLSHRLAWLAESSLEEADAELATWRGLVAGWAEEPSKPMCAEVQQGLLAALCDDLDTRTAIGTMRRSLELDLPPGCLFETWVWADRLLALDLASQVGR